MRLSSRVGLVLAISLSVISASVAGSFKGSSGDAGLVEPRASVAKAEPEMRLSLAAFLPIGISHAGDTDAEGALEAPLNERERRMLIDRVKARLAGRISEGGPVL